MFTQTEELTCSICLQIITLPENFSDLHSKSDKQSEINFENSEFSLPAALSCGHIFHLCCIEESLSRGSSSCPYCKAEIKTSYVKKLMLTTNMIENQISHNCIKPPTKDTSVQCDRTPKKDKYKQLYKSIKETKKQNCANMSVQCELIKESSPRSLVPDSEKSIDYIENPLNENLRYSTESIEVPRLKNNRSSTVTPPWRRLRPGPPMIIGSSNKPGSETVSNGTNQQQQPQANSTNTRTISPNAGTVNQTTVRRLTQPQTVSILKKETKKQNYAKARLDYESKCEDAITFKAGHIIALLDTSQQRPVRVLNKCIYLWSGKNMNNESTGFFPSYFVEKLDYDPFEEGSSTTLQQYQQAPNNDQGSQDQNTTVQETSNANGTPGTTTHNKIIVPELPRNLGRASTTLEHLKNHDPDRRAMQTVNPTLPIHQNSVSIGQNTLQMNSQNTQLKVLQQSNLIVNQLNQYGMTGINAQQHNQQQMIYNQQQQIPGQLDGQIAQMNEQISQMNGTAHSNRSKSAG